MKKKIKYLLLFIIILITSGCSVEYNLYINEDNSITEKVIASENTKKLESLTRSKGSSAVTYIYNMYKRNDDKIDLTTIEEAKNTKVSARTSHNDILEYSEKFKSDVFNRVYIQKNNNIVTFTSKQSEKLTDDDNYSLIYDDITIKIYIPFKVIEHNANSVQGNMYIWKINKNEDLKEIKFSYDEGSKKNNLNIRLNNKTYNINYVFIAISGIIVVLLIIILTVCIKNKKNNIV